MINPQPVKIYQGTIEEVLSHREEIPAGTIVELKVFDQQSQQVEEVGDFGGKSLYEVYGHLFGTVEGGPTDVARNPKKYREGFGKTRDRRDLEP